MYLILLFSFLIVYSSSSFFCIYIYICITFSLFPNLPHGIRFLPSFFFILSLSFSLYLFYIYCIFFQFCWLVFVYVFLRRFDVTSVCARVVVSNALVPILFRCFFFLLFFSSLQLRYPWCVTVYISVRLKIYTQHIYTHIRHTRRPRFCIGKI